jgi:hypothetical protein
MPLMCQGIDMFLLCDPAGDNYSKTCVSELKIFSAEQNILQTVYIQINGVTEHRKVLQSRCDVRCWFSPCL